MLKNFLIGIPVRNFKNPMSRLENVLSVEKRIELSKGMFENIVKSFKNEDTNIVCITNDELVIDYCKNNDIEIFSARKKGLNFELEEFLHSYEYEYWTICHADLPYLNNFYAQEWIKDQPRARRQARDVQVGQEFRLGDGRGAGLRVAAVGRLWRAPVGPGFGPRHLLAAPCSVGRPDRRA